MRRHFIVGCGALAVAIALMPQAGASQYSDWSTPVNLGPSINSSSADGGPAISENGLALYFNSSRPGGFGDADLYVARRETTDAPWDTPVNLGEIINTPFFDGFPNLSRDEHYLFFVSPRASGTADIWVSYRRDTDDDFAWEPPALLGPSVNTTAADHGPSYFENKKLGIPQLYFHSNRPGGPGSNDIYVADAFGPAVLVAALSSPQVDARPAISRNGLEMFFHSNRPGTIGGFDMWSSVRASVFEPWSSPENLGDTVNGAFDDFIAAISSDGDTLFFTSSRPEGFGSNDIYVTTRSRQ
jgi:Tol biopolymer transport system component